MDLENEAGYSITGDKRERGTTRCQADAANDAGAQHWNNTAPMFRADHIHSHVPHSVCTWR